ncbi:MAG: N-acetylmuramoyl-L-alanine amidase [Pseudomonadota bacterium]
MRVKGTTVQQVILGAALLAALCWNLAQANEIRDLQLIEGAGGTRAELHLQGDVAFRTLSLPNPDRFVVDLPETVPAATLQLPAPVGMIRSVRRGQPAPGTTRIVFDLAAPVKPLPRLERGAEGVRLVLEWPGSGARPNVAAPSAGVPASTATVAAAMPPQNPAAPGATPTGPAVVVDKTAAPRQVPVPSASSAVAASSTPASADKPAVPSVDPQAKPAAPLSDAAVPAGRGLRDLRAGTRPLIVAIDAGHGGQDPGAIGPTGKREKDVTLAIARELARQVNATPGLKAVLTRDSDMFLPLTRRTQLARQAKADIFISIHADAAENRAARGSSVYVLSLRGASSQRARWLADKENAADLIGGAGARAPDNTLASVLLDLTQSGQMKASEDAAGHVLSGLKDIGFNHKPHIERANFAVLRTSDMPAMLVETAFISNPDEERRLTDPAYQRALARAVLEGVDTYFTRQPPPGTLYAVRARAAEATVVASAAPVVAPKSAAPKAIATGGSP